MHPNQKTVTFVVPKLKFKVGKTIINSLSIDITAVSLSEWK